MFLSFVVFSLSAILQHQLLYIFAGIRRSGSFQYVSTRAPIICSEPIKMLCVRFSLSNCLAYFFASDLNKCWRKKIPLFFNFAISYAKYNDQRTNCLQVITFVPHSARAKEQLYTQIVISAVCVQRSKTAELHLELAQTKILPTTKWASIRKGMFAVVSADFRIKYCISMRNLFAHNHISRKKERRKKSQRKMNFSKCRMRHDTKAGVKETNINNTFLFRILVPLIHIEI